MQLMMERVDFPNTLENTSQKGELYMNRTRQSTHMAAAGWPNKFFYLIQFTWGLSANILGLLVFLCCRKRFSSEPFCNSIVTWLPGDLGGLSLGIFIFLSAHSAHERRRLCIHEYGHTVQCLFLGPLYWLVIVIPSVIWFHFFAGYRKKHHTPYDALYCEHWATAWGKRWSRL